MKRATIIVGILLIMAFTIYSNTGVAKDVPTVFKNEQYLNERALLDGLAANESGVILFDEEMSVEDARLFRYEFYAKYPEVTLNYSPRFKLRGYEKPGVCVGYTVTFISDSTKFDELFAATSSYLESMADASDEAKATTTVSWIKNRCSYTKHIHDMWDESLYGCLVQGEATCLGFSQGYFYMMTKLGVPCRIETNTYHAWNQVYYNGEWHKVDLTR